MCDVDEMLFDVMRRQANNRQSNATSKGGATAGKAFFGWYESRCKYHD